MTKRVSDASVERKHINLFTENSSNVSRNLDFEREKDNEQSDWEKKVGLLRKFGETQTGTVLFKSKPWYTSDRQKVEAGKVKNKKFHDPMKNLLTQNDSCQKNVTKNHILNESPEASLDDLRKRKQIRLSREKAKVNALKAKHGHIYNNK